jgi:glycyl-tRNA synthetase beta chain
MHRLLIEIGTEELPPSFLAPAAAELERRIRALLGDHGITAGPAEQFSAPRRLAVRFADVPAEKPAATVEVQGPPKRAAFDADGKPTRTAVGFSTAQGRRPEDIYCKTTPRGEYAFVKKEQPAVPTASVLAGGLAAVVKSLPFPKSMRWDASGLRFARPVRWLVCLLGAEPVRFGFDTLQSGALTRGHRNHTPEPVAIPAPEDYEAVLERHRVIAAHPARRARIESELARLAGEVGGAPVADEELLEESADITEYPEPVRCAFDPAYLDLPAEVLITALKKHQRCFSIQRADGPGLVPGFIAVTNTPGCDHTAVRTWYEKAVDSRLRDARFFVTADLRRGLEPLVEEEKRVVWIEEMGSYFDKTERLRAICRFLARAVPAADATALDRAALLCKTDLLTEMVREKEFTSLQGIIGGIYARRTGEPEKVAAAIAGHYLPNFAGDALPATVEAALLSIADKLDNIVATFLTGAIPTGSEDPFALRRQAAGIFAIILERGLGLDTAELLGCAVGRFEAPDPDHAARLPGFLIEREAQALADRAVPYDVANAVLAAFGNRPVTALNSARALAHFRSQPEFERLIVGQKRVANILKKEKVTGQPDPAAFVEAAERLLWDESRAAEPGVIRALDTGDYDRAFELLLGLRPAIDKFFDDVLVMDKDERVRTNRLCLLASVRALFGRVADLSKIVIEGEGAGAGT